MLAVLTCRNCGRVYEMPDGLLLCPCVACGTVNEPPRAEGEALDKLRRAVRLRTRGEFILAEQCYNAVLAEYDDEHEALWGRLLCHYGVEFVVDEKTGGRFPVVHIPRRTLMQESADFVQACELAPEEIRAQYEADAAYVDEAQAEIRLLAEHSPAYDVFICHKTTQLDSDAKTEDYDRAFKLYHGLDKQGFRVFFAPMELAGVAGANYEAGIYHALHTARVMLVVCSDAAYLNSTWVQSEWRRYLELMGDEGDATPRTLIPLLYGMSAGRLPAPFRLRKLQGISMSDFGADAALMAVLQKYCGAPVTPYAPEDDFVTVPVDGGCSISVYRGKGGRVEIPPEIRGAKVVEIGESAFENCLALTGVVIPEGVRCIGMMAFSGCAGLTEVSIPGSVKRILFGAFSDCVGLTRVTLPEGLTYLSDEVFDSCEKLADVNLPGSVTDVRWNPFTDCPSLRTIRVAADNPRYAMRDGVLVSREGVLHCYPAGLRAAHFDVPAHVRSIALGAFEGCDILQTVHVPETVTHIEEHAFGNEPRMTLRVHEGSAAYAWAQKNGVAVEVLVSYAPESHFKTEEYYDGTGVSIYEYIGPGGLVKVPPTIGGRPVVEVGASAFADCEQLTDVVLPEGLKRIGDHAFAWSGLRSIHIPSTVNDMIDGLFEGCSRLEKITVAEENAKYRARDNVLLDSTGSLIRYPAGLKANSYTVPEDVTCIDALAFEGCTNLKELRLPDGLERIWNSAFSGCTGLTSLTLPEGLFYIAEKSFVNCPGLTLRVHKGSDSHLLAEKYNIPYTVIGAPQPVASQPQEKKYSPESCFQTEVCEGGVRITKYIGPGDCDIHIPRTVGRSTVVELGTMMFPDTENPMHVGCITIPETVRVFYAGTFRGVRPERYEVEPGNANFYARDGVVYHSGRKMLTIYPADSKNTHFDIPAGTEEIFDWALRSAANLQSVTVPSSVKSIGASVFSECRQLSSVQLAEGLESLGGWAFEDCRALQTITLPASLREVKQRAFLMCRNLREIRVAPGSSYLRVQDGFLMDTQGRLICCPPARMQTSCTVPEGVRNIEGGAFYACAALQRIELPASVEAIGDYAFFNCATLRSLNIPAMTATISENAFGGCRELTLRVHANSPAHAYAQRRNIPFEVLSADMPAGPAVKSAAMNYAPESHFQTEPCQGGCRIVKYTGPGGHVDIPEVIGGRSVTEIAESAFQRCGQLTSVTLPQSLRVLAIMAFTECTALRSVVIPRSVERIDGNPFAACTALESIVVENGNSRFHVRYGMLISSDGTLVSYASGLPVTTCVIPAEVKRIGTVAFSVSANLTSVHIPEGVTAIDAFAFSGCRALTALHIPASVTQIAANPCTWADALSQLTVAQGNTHFYVRDGVLFDRYGDVLVCHPAGLNAAEYRIPEGTAALASRAFTGCNSLRRVTAPASVRSVDDTAFRGCENLTLCAPEGSAAQAHARKLNIPFEVIRPQGTSAAAKPAQPAAKPAPAVVSELDPAYTYLLIKRSKRWVAAAGKIAVRVDEKDKDVLYFANGESLRLKLTPGHHQIDLKFKPMLGGAVKWSGMLCKKNVFPTVMEAGKEYVLDLADWIEKLQF